MRALNAVRLHLQVATLSDIVTADGVRIDPEALIATPSTSRKSTLNWIRQPTITDSQRQLWTQAIKLLLDKHDRLLQPLGPWHSEPNQQWLFYYNESTDSLLSSIYSSHPCEQFRTYPHGNETSPSDFFFDNDKYPMTSPPNYTSLAPVDVLTDDDFSTITFSYRRQEKQKRHSPNPQKAYIKNLPKSRQRLLKVGRIRPSRTTNEFYALVMHTLITGGNFNCGTDGGLHLRVLL